MRRSLSALFAPALALTLAAVLTGACGGGGGKAPAPAADARRIDVSAKSFQFDPSTITAKPGEDLAIALTSKDAVHDFVVEHTDFKIEAGKGKTTVGGLRLDKPGTYTFYCSIPGHRSAGMHGTIVVAP
ncbi:MAG TPA: cupredoxin domain-containing protein [Acidimicrobiales bacterium]|nr:cupredoxin domain-containing protein [Acidimicrobiales bacterium]